MYESQYHISVPFSITQILRVNLMTIITFAARLGVEISGFSHLLSLHINEFFLEVPKSLKRFWIAQFVVFYNWADCSFSRNDQICGN